MGKSLCGRRISGRKICAYNSHPAFRIAYIGDSLTYGLAAHYFTTFNPVMRSNARQLAADVLPTNIDGFDLYNGSITIYADGTATWTAPGDAAGARTNIVPGANRQLVYLESASPEMGVGIFFTPALVAEGTVEGTVRDFYFIQDDFSYSSTGYSAWSQALSGWRFDVTGSFGVSGDDADAMLGRLGDVFSVNSVGQPIASAPNIVVVNIGINGCDDLDTLDAIKDYIITRNSKVIFCNLAMEAPDAPQLEFIQGVNARLASLVDENTAVADFYGVTMSGSVAIAGRMDGVHYTPVGAQVVGAELVRVFDEMFGDEVGLSSFQSPNDPRNLWPAAMMVGTDGVLTGITGVSGIDAEFSGDGTCVASKEDVAGENPWQVFTITGASLGDTLILDGGEPPLDVAIGDSIYAEIEMEVSGAGVSIIAFGTIVKNFEDPPFKTIASVTLTPDFSYLEPLTDFHILHRSPVSPLPSWVIERAVNNQFILGEGNTVIKFRSGGAAKIN